MIGDRRDGGGAVLETVTTPVADRRCWRAFPLQPGLQARLLRRIELVVLAARVAHGPQVEQRHRLTVQPVRRPSARRSCRGPRSSRPAGRRWSATPCGRLDVGLGEHSLSVLCAPRRGSAASSVDLRPMNSRMPKDTRECLPAPSRAFSCRSLEFLHCNPRVDRGTAGMLRCVARAALTRIKRARPWRKGRMDDSAVAAVRVPYATSAPADRSTMPVGSAPAGRGPLP